VIVDGIFAAVASASKVPFFCTQKNGTFGVACKYPAALILNRKVGAERANLQTKRSEPRKFFGYFFSKK